MKAYLLHQAGQPQALKLTEIEPPRLKHDEVMVNVKAISINPVDTKARANEGVLSWVAGDTRPVVLGWDISGEIVEKGSAVTAFEIGDEVFGMVNFLGVGSAYAELVAAPASQLSKKQKNINHSESAASTLAALTALQVLNLAGVKAGEKVLIHAGSGGVGHFAVQLAKHFGCEVSSTSSAKNRDFVLSLGADHHLDYHDGPLSEKVSGFDFVFDTVGRAVCEESISLLKPSEGRIYSITTRELSPAAQRIAGSKMIKHGYHLVKSNGEDMQTLADLLEKGILKAHVSKEFSFEDLPKAHEAVETGRTVGKVIVSL
ncbi:NADP-dependent oxidoreductase [Jiulongibacter sediminis]|jgi:NADPH:quinone reductase-like Zn-dependent oxidoreductase|uniref:NADP-dependent oxidoreductase n=1 Tax=Jiulongibacter sediminis TaxID=1605367 RepID=UPI0026EF80EE|nr:NADP-dependent oxidoreductase [Jiulongibacter sediminis]